MPQEFHVLKCFSCETFQVQIIKKVNKWECKMCGEKQSVQKVYTKGTGKNCRLHVQQFNKIRVENENANITEHINKSNKNVELYKSIETKPKISKWSKYTTVDIENDLNDEVEDERYTFERPTKRKCNRNRKQTFGVKTTDSIYEPDIATYMNTNDQNYEPDIISETEIVHSISIKNLKDQDLKHETNIDNNDLINSSCKSDLNPKTINSKSVLKDKAINTSSNSDQFKNKNNLFNSQLVVNNKETINNQSICLEKNKNSSLGIKQPQHSKWTEYLIDTDTLNEITSDNIIQNEIAKENIFNTSNEDLDSILSF